MNLFNSNKDIWQTVGHSFIPASPNRNLKPLIVMTVRIIDKKEKIVSQDFYFEG